MIKDLNVADLLLDEANPRFRNPVRSQNEAINTILADALAAAKVLKLAQDIVEYGALNPTELMVVVEQDGRFVVIEGNRRLAALKLLRNPGLATDSAQQVQFKAVAAKGFGPAVLSCFVAESREAARHWIELRHTGENDGVGVVPWESWQANNFRRRPGTQADRADRFCVAVEAEFPNEVDLVRDVATVRRDRLTTLGRLVSDPVVRQDFGFDFTATGVLFFYPAAELLEGFKQIFRDLASNLGVTGIKTKEQREKYVKNSASVLPARACRLDSPREPGSPSLATSGTVSPASAQSNSAPGAGPNSRRVMPSQEQVIFKGLKLQKVDLRTSKLLAQAQTIDIDSTPAVSAILVRVLVELVTTEVGLKYGWAGEKDSLKQKIGAALKRLDPKIDDVKQCDKTLEPAWLRSQGHTATMVQTMNSFIHGIISNPTASEVRELSITFRPLLERLDSYLRSNP
jgi:hypothetical protein